MNETTEKTLVSPNFVVTIKGAISAQSHLYGSKITYKDAVDVSNKDLRMTHNPKSIKKDLVKSLQNRIEMLVEEDKDLGKGNFAFTF